MHHTLAFTRNMTAGSTNEAITPVGDQVATVTGNGMFMQQPLKLMGHFVNGATITGARLVAPTLRRIINPVLVPVHRATASADILGLGFYDRPLLELPALDPIEVQSSNGAGAAEQHTAILHVGDGNLNIPPEEPFLARATASITAGNLTWGAGAFTFDETLGPGRYAVVGMDVQGANLLAARLVFPGQVWRPGVVARTAVTVMPNPRHFNGRMGVFGEFNSTAQPTIELFGSAAPTTQTIFLHLIKVR